jgi:GT2 family glycosyltransferase
MPPEARPTVAAIVPHWNRRDLLPSFFESLRKQHRLFDEVILVDNGSTDDSVTLAESHGAQVLRLGRNLGFAAAVNRGIEAARTDWVAILNNDVTLDPTWLARLLDRAIAANAAFATGKTLNAANPSILDGAYIEISRGACALQCGAGKPDSPLWNQERTIRFAPMTAALFRRDLFAEIGGLDESFGSYLEDVDFGIRCAAQGRNGVYVPSAVAYHRGSSTLGPWSKDTVWHISRNQILLAVKHFQGQPYLPILVGQLLWGLVTVRHSRSLSFLRGKLAGLRGRPDTVKTGRPTSADAAGGTPRDLGAIFESSEKEILAIQRQTGFDGYWRAYFWLVRP